MENNGMNQLLNRIIVDKDGPEKILNECVKFYQNYKRHYYHEVTLFLVDKIDYDDPSKMDEIIVLTTRIKKLIDVAAGKCLERDLLSKCRKTEGYKGKCSSSQLDCRKYKDTSHSLIKLYDHIQLEVIRLDKTNQQNQNAILIATSALGQMDQNNKMQKILKEGLDVATKEFESKSELLEENVKDINEKLKNFNMESITVLGIFSGIVMAFFGGISFFNGVLNNIHQASIYRISFIALIVGFTLFNTLFLLIYSISKIVDRPIRTRCKSSDCSSCEDNCNLIKTIVKIYPILFYIDLIFILMIMGVLVLWFSNNQDEIAQLFDMLNNIKCYLLAGFLMVVAFFHRKQILRFVKKHKNIEEHELSH